MEIVNELRDKHAFKLSEDTNILLTDKLLALNKANTINSTATTSHLELPKWFNDLNLATYKRILEKQDVYLKWLKRDKGDFDTELLLTFLESKYSEAKP